MTTAPPLGLREEKKQLTRTTIADTALALFLERGFDAVPVSEIAREARVSEATVFNYFGTKEELVYGRFEAFWSRLIAAVADRLDDVSAVTAFESFLLSEPPRLGTPVDRDRLFAITTMITSSPALLTRELDAYERVVSPLAAAIGRAPVGTSDDLFTARVLLALHHTLVDELRTTVLSGRATARLAPVIAARVTELCARLVKGVEC